MSRRLTIENPAQQAVIYARYSSHAQKDVSIEQQVEECKDFAKKQGLQVSRVYADRHLSGRSDRRPEFQRMMRDAKKSQFDVIIAYKSNRMSRRMLHALSYEEELERQGVRVAYAKEEFGDNAAGRFALRMMMNMNQFYSENMSEDILRGMMDNAQQCKVNSGAIPLGYRKGEDGRFALDEKAVPVVQEIFERVARGDTYAEIAADLNARRIRTVRGNEWNKSSFHVMLKNERYLGIYIYNGVRIEGGMPAIISQEVFDQVQDQLKRKRATRSQNRWQKSDYLLTGKLYCGHCLSPMVGYSGTSMTKATHYYYVCQKRNLEKACHKKNVRKNAAERLVANAIRQYILVDDTIEWIADNAMKYQKEMKASSAVKETEAELAEVKRQLANLVNAVANGIFNDTTQERMLALEEDQRQITRRLETEKRTLPTFTREQVLAWLNSYRTRKVDDPGFRKELFDTFLEAAYLYDDRLRLVFNYTGEVDTFEAPLHQLLDNGPEQSSDTLAYGPPKASDTNYREVILYRVRDKFVLDIQVKDEDLQ